MRCFIRVLTAARLLPPRRRDRADVVSAPIIAARQAPSIVLRRITSPYVRARPARGRLCSAYRSCTVIRTGRSRSIVIFKSVGKHAVQTFASRFMDLAAERSPLCVGIDPSPELLRAWGFADDRRGLTRFCETILEAANGDIAIFKPQAAFFERFGPVGMTELSRVVRLVHDQGALCLIDCKRGDIGHTVEAYADAYFGPESAFQADAITLAPYLGLGALTPAFDRAASAGAAVFVVVCSSNPEGAEIQQARLSDGRSVSEALSDQITAINSQHDAAVGPIGAVVGATIPDALSDIVARLPRSLFLVPGIGAQGATFDDVARTFRRVRNRIIPSVSRGILSQGPSIAGLRTTLTRYRQQARFET